MTKVTVILNHGSIALHF